MTNHQYRCNALPRDDWSHLDWEQSDLVGASGLQMMCRVVGMSGLMNWTQPRGQTLCSLRQKSDEIHTKQGKKIKGHHMTERKQSIRTQLIHIPYKMAVLLFSNQNTPAMHLLMITVCSITKIHAPCTRQTNAMLCNTFVPKFHTNSNSTTIRIQKNNMVLFEMALWVHHWPIQNKLHYLQMHAWNFITLSTELLGIGTPEVYIQ